MLLLLAPEPRLAAHNDAAFGEEDFAANLERLIHPACMTVGVMYLAQISDSLRVFLLIIPSLGLPLIDQGTLGCPSLCVR